MSLRLGWPPYIHRQSATNVDPVEDNAWQMLIGFLLYLELGFWRSLLAFALAYLAALTLYLLRK